MKNIMKFLAAMAALMTSGSASALSWSDLKPSDTDATMIIIHQLFGDVGGLLGTGQTSVLAALFETYNAGIMILSGILIGYIIFAGMLKTAHEGEVLGRAWSSVWIPLRASLSVGLLIPGPSGYCLAQMAVLSVAIGGVGLANKGYEVVASSIIYGKPNLVRNVDAQTVVAGALKTQLCTANKEKISVAAGLGTAYPGGHWATPKAYRVGNTLVYTWGECGKIEFQLSSNNPNQIDQIYVAKAEALTTIVLPATALMASQLVDGVVPVDFDKTLSAVSDNYRAHVVKVAEKVYGRADPDNAYLEHVKKDGWIMAGGGFLTLSKVMKNNNTAAVELPVYTPPSLVEMEQFERQEFQTLLAFAQNQQKIALDKRLQAQTTPQQYAASATERISAAASFTIDDIVEGSIVSKISKPLSDTLMSVLLMALLPPFEIMTGHGIAGDYIGDFATYAGAGLTGVTSGSPFLSLIHLGEVIDNIVALVASLFITVPTAVHAALGAVPTISSGNAMTTLAVTAFPLIISTICGLGVAGLTLSHYLPAMPAILWVFAVAGYLAILVESMVASPLWIAMHATPEGDDMAGKGAAGYLIILSVFLRPFLMILGLFAGMMMIGVVVTLWNFLMLMTIKGIGGTGAIGAVFFICLYVFIAYKLIHTCLSLITEVPSGIMRWIGGGHDPLNKDDGHGGSSSFVGGIATRMEHSTATAATSKVKPAGGPASPDASGTPGSKLSSTNPTDVVTDKLVPKPAQKSD